MLRTIASVLLILLLNSAHVVQAEEPPKRSAELQIFERFLGEWETVGTGKAANEKEVTHERYQWSRGGNFMMCECHVVSNKKEAHFLMTYDSDSKQYRSCLVSDTSSLALVGTWDEATQTLTWKDADAPVRIVAVNRFLDKDHIDISVTLTNAEGKVEQETTAKKTRVK